ncbi:MAG: glycosyltransferase family 2 protein, partial [Sulfitobacter sp.]
MMVISLSSIPPRFGTLGVVLRSLVAQSAPLTEIRLNIPKAYRRFPQDSFSMPDVPDGVRIAVVDEDLGPATKVLPTLLDHAGTQMPIIFGDDDRVVHPD